MSEGKLGNTIHKYAGDSFREFVATSGESDFGAMPVGRDGSLAEVDIETSLERGLTELQVTQVESAVKDLAADAVLTDVGSKDPSLGEVDYPRGIRVLFQDKDRVPLMESVVYGKPLSYTQHELLNTEHHAGVKGGVEQVVWKNTTEGLGMERVMTPINPQSKPIVGDPVVTEQAPGISDYQGFRAGLEDVIKNTAGVSISIPRKGMNKGK